MATTNGNVRTKLQEKVIKDSFNVKFTHVGQVPMIDVDAKTKKESHRVDASGNCMYEEGIYSSLQIRYKAVNDEQAMEFALRDIQRFSGELDLDSIDDGTTAIVRFPDGTFTFIANDLSDTQCDVCGAVEGTYNVWCPECQRRKLESQARGTGSKKDALLKALQAKDTRRGR